MNPPADLYRARISTAARLVGCRLWELAEFDENAGMWIVEISKRQLREDLDVPRGSLDRHIRHLADARWLRVTPWIAGKHTFYMTGPAPVLPLLPNGIGLQDG